MRLPWSREQRVATAVRQVTPAHGGGRTNLVAPTPALTTPRSLPAISPRRFATVVVGAADSAVNDTEVDFRCSGTNDDVTVQAAINYAFTLGIYGVRVLLLAGTYLFSAPVNVTPNVGGLILEGEGASLHQLGGTIIDCNSSTVDAFTTTYEGIVIRHMVIKQCDLAIELTIDNFVIEDIIFDSVKRPIVMVQVGSGHSWYYDRISSITFGNGCGGSGLYLIDANWTTGDAFIDLIIEDIQHGDGVAAVGTAGTIRLKTTSSTRGDYIRISDNHLVGTLIDAEARILIYADNFDGDVEIRNGGDVLINGNYMHDLTLNTITNVSATGNNVWGTYSATSVTTIAKAGNIGIP